MTASSPSPISSVSDTARWVAMYRAMESERPDALFHDPYARRLAGDAGAQGKRTLVIAEGLLVYLKPEEVLSLATDLAEQSAFQWWLIDLGSPTLLKFLHRTWGNQLRSGNAPMLFAPAEGTAFFAPAGWHEAEYRAILDEAFRLQRAPKMAWLWRLLGLFASKKRREEFKRFSGVVLLNRQSRGTG